MPNPRWFRPTDDENVFLDELKEKYNIGFSEFCRWAIRRKTWEINMKKIKKKRANNRVMVNNLILVFLGVLFFALTYITMPFIIFLALNICALICIAGGLLLIVKEARRQQLVRNGDIDENDTFY